MLVVMSKPSEAAARWCEIVRGHGESGLPVVAYCRRTRVAQSSFYAWRRKLREMGVRPVARRPASPFAEVRVTPELTGPKSVNGSASEADALEVRLAGGRRIVVRAGFDRQTLLDLLDTLERDAAGPAGVADREVRV